MRPFGQALLGAKTFYAAVHGNDACGPNGLPLTPNSILILGRFRELLTLDHQHLCKYVDLVRGKHERITVVFEYYRESIASKLSADASFYRDARCLIRTSFEVLAALSYLHGRSIVHRNLSPDNVLLNHTGQVKLHDYGLYHATEFGGAVSFPIGLPKYLPPETLLDGPTALSSVHFVNSECPELESMTVGCNPNVDTWSLGVMLLEMVAGRRLWQELGVEQQVTLVLSRAQLGQTPLDVALEDPAFSQNYQELTPDVQDFISKCLVIDPRERLTATKLLKFGLFKGLTLDLLDKSCSTAKLFSVQLRSESLGLADFDDSDIPDDYDHLSELRLDDVYYLWRLAGGDLDAVMRCDELQQTCQPPVVMLCSFVTADGDQYGSAKDPSRRYDRTVVVLPLDQLRERLAIVDACDYYPLIEEFHDALATSSSSGTLQSPETSRLPLIIKERDVEYQMRRLLLFRRLLAGSPYTRPQILKEARTDVPPRVRGMVWAVLLDVQGDVQARYDRIDKETPKAIDRQIEVDIPRCHQYNELISSPDAHRRLRRVLKAWVVSHPQYVYWQGLDSLSAPFVYLLFEYEALAFACLEQFIDKYLHNFFLKDNAAVIQEYLAVFCHLIAFHEPELSNHMEEIGFFPDLYAIPWFLTMYAHVFPLHRLFHLWDMLLLGGPATPFFIAIAILQQLKSRLLQYGFNECILLFSDLPEIDIEQCVKDCVKIFHATPRSASYRQYAQSTAAAAGDRPAAFGLQQPPATGSYQSDLILSPVPLNVLKEERCPRISGDDLLLLLGVRSNKSSPASDGAGAPAKQQALHKPRLIVIDIRRKEDFVRGMIPGSINMPYTSAFTDKGDLVATAALDALESSKNLVKVVVDSSGRNCSTFANRLLKLGYSKVCMLHKGMDAIKNTGILVISAADL